MNIKLLPLESSSPLFVPVIKTVRELTGMALKESVDAVKNGNSITVSDPVNQASIDLLASSGACVGHIVMVLCNGMIPRQQYISEFTKVEILKSAKLMGYIDGHVDIISTSNYKTAVFENGKVSFTMVFCLKG